MSQTLQESQTDTEDGEPDPHDLSRDQNDKMIESVFGPSRKGRRRFRGSGIWTSGSTMSSFGSTMPSSMQRTDESQAVRQLTEHMINILVTKLSPAVFATAMPLMIGSFTISDTLDTAKKSMVISLAGKIPDDVYIDVVKEIMGPDARSSQRSDIAGSTSVIPTRDIEDEVDGDKNDVGEE